MPASKRRKLTAVLIEENRKAQAEDKQPELKKEYGLPWLTYLALEKHREIVRMKAPEGRMTHDCFNQRVTPNGLRVKCAKGFELSSRSLDKAVPLEQVLKGAKLGVCQLCTEFNDGGGPAD